MNIVKFIFEHYQIPNMRLFRGILRTFAFKIEFAIRTNFFELFDPRGLVIWTRKQEWFATHPNKYFIQTTVFDPRGLGIQKGVSVFKKGSRYPNTGQKVLNRKSVQCMGGRNQKSSKTYAEPLLRSPDKAIFLFWQLYYSRGSRYPNYFLFCSDTESLFCWNTETPV